jgi:hypothetical protein
VRAKGMLSWGAVRRFRFEVDCAKVAIILATYSRQNHGPLPDHSEQSWKSRLATESCQNGQLLGIFDIEFHC